MTKCTHRDQGRRVKPDFMKIGGKQCSESDEEQNLIKQETYVQQEKMFMRAPRHSPNGIRMRGSLTMEAAVVFPFFFLAVMQIVLWINFLQKQADLSAEANRTARRISMERFMEAPGKENVFTIPKGAWLNRVYFPVNAIGRAFTGRYYPKEKGGEETEDTIVFVTKSGTVYHTSSLCTHIKLSVTEISGEEVLNRRNTGGGKYYPCEFCMRGKTATGRVFITKEGNRVHTKKDCAGIKRTVRSMNRTEAERRGFKRCERCGGNID